jgi:hypothetical protein
MHPLLLFLGALLLAFVVEEFCSLMSYLTGGQG